MPGLNVTPIERGRERNSDENIRIHRISNLCEGKDEFVASTPEEQRSILLKTTKTNGSSIRKLRDKKIGRIFIYPVSIYSNNEKYTHRKNSGERLFSNDDLYDKFTEKFIMAFAISLPSSSREIRNEIEYVNETI